VWARCALLGASLAAAYAQDTVFRDGDFADADWEMVRRIQVAPPDLASLQVTRQAAGGNPGAFLQVDIRLTATGESPIGAVRAAVVMIRRSATYTPSSQGAIASIDYSEEARNVHSGTSPAGGQRTGLALRQNGKIFVLQDLITRLPAAWTGLGRASLTATHFAELDMVEMFLRTGSRPDFSSTGARIEFGFWRGNDLAVSSSPESPDDPYTPPFRGAPALRHDSVELVTAIGIDNWSVTLRRSIQAGVFCQFVPRNAYLSGHRQELHLLEPARYPIHGLSVDVFADGRPAPDIDVTLVASQPVFAASAAERPTQARIVARTDANGRATVSTNPPTRTAFDRTDFTADGTVSGRPFSCTNTILAGAGALSGPLQSFVDAETTRAFLQELRRKVLALGKRLAARPDLVARLEQMPRLRRLVDRWTSGSRVEIREEDIREAERLVARLENDRDSELRRMAGSLLANIRTAKTHTEAARLPAPVGEQRLPPRHVWSAAAAGYGRLPLGFEPNLGQAGARVRYLARTAEASFYFEPRQAAVVRTQQGKAPVTHLAAMRMAFEGANPAARIAALDRLPGASNYLTGADPSRWRLGVPRYARVVYHKLYPGVDLVFHGRERKLQFDFILDAGARPERIALRFSGVQRIEADGAGGLWLHYREGRFRLEKPFAYQEVDGRRQDAGGRFVLKPGGLVGFELARYDARKPAVIDPVISYGTFVGGARDEVAMAVAVDAQGSAYLTGATASPELATAGALQTALNGGPAGRTDAFVTKLNSAGTALVYSTYIGGSAGDIGLGIAVDAAGSAYVTGATTSADFPLAQAFQRVFAGGGLPIPSDAFVLKLNPAGTALVYSTYLGGSGLDVAKAIALDSSGAAYIAGFTSSRNLPVKSAFQVVNRGGQPLDLDAFAAKLNPAGTELVYLTYAGGTLGDVATSLAVDSAGNAYLTGKTYSPDFPVMNALQADKRNSVDAFVLKLNAAGSALAYSTFLGGGSYDVGLGIAVDAAGAAHVTGVTGSSDFPLGNAVQSRFGTPDGLGADAFLTKLTPAGNALAYSTFLGGRGTDVATAVAVGADGSAYVAGETDSPDFPAVNAIQTFGSGNEVFLARMNPAGSAFQYVTLLGGSGHDGGASLAVDRSGNAYVAGATASGDLPVSYGSYQGASRGQSEAMVLKLADGASMPRFYSVSAASLQAPVAPSSLASGFGQRLAETTASAPAGPPPETLAGVSVRVKDRAGTTFAAGLISVSPTQIQYLVPEGLESGLAEVSVLAGERVVATGTVLIERVAPALFTASGTGRGVVSGYAIRVAADDSESVQALADCAAATCTPTPLSLGPEGERVFLVLRGTGIRNVSSLSAVTATVGGEPVEVMSAGAQGEYPGLDEVKLGPLPRAQRGAVDIVLRAEGKTANPVTVMLVE
jgi:uncharacterized protein (TIGR03437 family)